MNLLRHLLALLVAIAVPLQGFASVAGLHCGTDSKPPEVHKAAAHDSHGIHAGHHHHEETGTPVGAGQDHHDGGHSGCAPCAACCAAAFISAFPPVPAVAPAPLEHVAFVLPPAHAIDHEPLDRPPLAL